MVPSDNYPGGDSWNEWSKHILKELERLNTISETIKKELSEVREELAVIRNQQTTLGELKEWKKEMDNVASPVQVKTMREDLEKLKTFKTVATTTWAVLQIIFGAVLALLALWK